MSAVAAVVGRWWAERQRIIFHFINGRISSRCPGSQRTADPVCLHSFSIIVRLFSYPDIASKMRYPDFRISINNTNCRYTLNMASTSHLMVSCCQSRYAQDHLIHFLGRVTVLHTYSLLLGRVFYGMQNVESCQGIICSKFDADFFCRMKGKVLSVSVRNVTEMHIY